jgi:glycerol-3-phosphate dehydrogenase
MERIQTEVLVIGGGATGTGIARDLAMRGFKTILVEKGDLTQGTTGRYHGLLHSGGRYVVKDPQAAKECIAENWILRKIMPFCIEDTGGFFVSTPWDESDYVPRFLVGCKAADIPVEEISIAEMLRTEPMLNPQITRCFRVPDASADSFLAADANAESALQFGAQIRNYHKVVRLLRENDRITGAICEDLVGGEEVQIDSDMILNASGAWAGRIAALADLNVTVTPGKGTMVALNHRIVNTVINRCKLPSDGDILVPTHTVSVIGTTDVKVEDPDHFAIEPWEVALLMDEGEKLVPGFKEMRVLRAWAGVRPLYQEANLRDTRDFTRAYVLLDHEKRDGLSNIITITGGKWTTYRKMAEVTVDLVCEKLGTSRPCRTQLEILPKPEYMHDKSGSNGYFQPGEHLHKVEGQQSYGNLICECELATVDDVTHAIHQQQVKTIEDIRRDVRLGMGPCQGGFCTFRVTGLLHRLRKSSVLDTNLALHDFLQERWKGLLPILWGQQLRQERLNELIYLSLFNADHLPGPQSGALSPELYEISQSELTESSKINSDILETSSKPSTFIKNKIDPGSQKEKSNNILDLLVVGAGLSGLAAAWQAAENAERVRLVSKGWGALYWHTGCIDVLGYDPTRDSKLVDNPAESLLHLVQDNPDHPYAKLGMDHINRALEGFKYLCTTAGYEMQGSLDHNWLFPTAVGAIRPTCLAPAMMIAGELHKNDPILVVGFEGFPDFYPELIAANLTVQGIPAHGLSLSLPVLKQHKFITGRVLAELFDQLELCELVAEEIKRLYKPDTSFRPLRIGFPAVLGLEKPLIVKGNLQNMLSLPVFEIPTLPPSIPGIRLSQVLVSAIESKGGRVFEGMQVNTSIHNAGKIVEFQSEAASRQKAHRAENYILATGGILGGGIRADYDGSIIESICHIPIPLFRNRSEWFDRKFLSPSGHPLYRSGISVNDRLQPVNDKGQPVYENLYVAGNLLSGGDFLQERSTDGIALVTGFYLGSNHRTPA